MFRAVATLVCRAQGFSKSKPNTRISVYLWVQCCPWLNLHQGGFHLLLLSQQRHYLICVELLVCLERCQALQVVPFVPVRGATYTQNFSKSKHARLHVEFKRCWSVDSWMSIHGDCSWKLIDGCLRLPKLAMACCFTGRQSLMKLSNAMLRQTPPLQQSSHSKQGRPAPSAAAETNEQPTTGTAIPGGQDASWFNTRGTVQPGVTGYLLRSLRYT